MNRVAEQPRKLVWLVDTLDALRALPIGVRQKLGFALYQAQIGDKHEKAKPLHGFKAPVLGGSRRCFKRDLSRHLRRPLA